MSPILFDRSLLRKRRARAAANFGDFDFLLREIAEIVSHSLSFLKAEFPTIVELGCHTGQLAKTLAKRPRTQHYIQCDLSPEMLQKTQGLRVAVDEEFLPFADGSVDAVVSIGGLHYANDLPGTLAQIFRMLKPDGLFMAVLPGVETLHELRQAFAATDAAHFGGISPRVSPFVDVRDAGGLLQRAGFALPVADREMLSLSYENMFTLMRDLRGSGEQLMLQQRLQHFTPRGWFQMAAQRYAEQFADAEGRIPVTVELVTMTGWKPAPNQQQPAKRGSGTVSFLDALS